LPRWTAPPQRVVPGNLQCPKPTTKSQRKINYSLNLSACVEPEKILFFMFFMPNTGYTTLPRNIEER